MDLSWNSLKKNHMAIMVICCAIPILLILAVFAAGWDVRTYSWIILLLCPLGMMWMMKDMHSGHAEKADHAGHSAEGSMKNEPPAKKESCH